MKHIRSSAIAAALAALALLISTSADAGSRAPGVDSSGEVVIETTTPPEFTRIHASGAFEVVARVGPSPSIELTCDRAHLKYIDISIDDGTLRLGQKRGFRGAESLRVVVTTPRLSGVQISGANDVVASGIHGERLHVEASGAGDVVLSGEVGTLVVDISGAADVDARELIARTVRVDLSGAASADVHATEELDVTISGVGDVDCYGTPARVRQEISGLGSLDMK